jgi:hypothetical protein
VGQEYEGTLDLGGKKVAVKGDFGSDRVVFSGGRRGEVKYADIQVVSTAKGRLTLRVAGSLMEFPVGMTVDRLANKIRKPPTTAEKMGLKPGVACALVNVPDGLVAEAKAVLGSVLTGLPRDQVDVLAHGVEDAHELEEVEGWARLIKPDGALWVVYPKGKRELPETMVLEAGRRVGLKDVKVVRVSEKHTGLKFVLPLADRPSRRPR